MLKVIVGLVACGTILGAAPHITAIVSAADFQYGIAFSGIATIFGTGLAETTRQYTSLPYPTILGSTEAFVCVRGNIPQVSATLCEPLKLIFVSATQINFQMLDSLPSRPGFSQGVTAVIRVAGVLDDGAATGTGFGGLISAFGGAGGSFSPRPRIFLMGYDCLIDARSKDANKNCGLTSSKPTTEFADRGAITDQQGRLLTSAIRARLGDYYTIWVTNLGRLSVNGKQPPDNFFVRFLDVPVYGYPGPTNLNFESATYVGESLQYPGLYQVNFQLPKSIAGGHPSGYPPLFPCGNYEWEISIYINWGGASSNVMQIPVTIRNGDVPCAL